MTEMTLEDALAEQLVEFLQQYNGDALKELQSKAEIRDSKPGSNPEPSVLYISLDELAAYNTDIFDDVLNNPDWFRWAFQELAHDWAEETEYHVFDRETELDISVAAYDLPEDTKIVFTDPPKFIKRGIGQPIRDEDRGKLIAIEGLCQQVSDPKPRIIETAFVCQQCGAISDVVDLSETFDLEEAEPYQCKGCERQGPFERSQNHETTEQYQQLRLQEPPEDAENAARPRDITCDVQGEHMMDVIQPGDRATVVGVVREDKDSDSTLRDHRLDVEAVLPLEQRFEEIELDDEELEQIKELASQDNIYSLVQHSIAPGLYGHDKVKLAVGLQLFGGVTKRHYNSRKRGEIHVFCIGDPGTGKSVILESARALAPRGVSASGTSSTAVGLTASAQKEKIGDEEEWTVQAGALVLADGGIITIDELDNFREEQQAALDEALSEGHIVVNKGNVNNVKLNSRCSALMAANPKDGRFNVNDAIGDQFAMPSELINRCDIIWPFFDKPDDEVDENIVDAIFESHGDTAAAATDGGKVMAVDDNGVINEDIFQKYIAYARREIEPSLTDAARDKLKDYYLSIREGLSEKGDDYYRISINTRQFEGLIRLTKASARVRLDEDANEEDAQRAIDLLQTSLNKLAQDPESGKQDIDIIEHGRSQAQKDRIDTVRSLIVKASSEYDEGAPVDVVIEGAVDKGFNEQKAEQAIQKLKDKGEVYEPVTDYLRTT